MTESEYKAAYNGGYVRHDKGNFFHSVLMPDRRLTVPWVIIMIAWMVAHFGYGYIPTWVVVPFCISSPFLFMSISWRFTIEFDKKLIRNEAFFFNRRKIAEKTYRFRDFHFIAVEMIAADEGSIFNVVLVLKSGRKLSAKNCGVTSRPAEELAWRLSCETGIPLKGEPVSEPNFLQKSKSA